MGYVDFAELNAAVSSPEQIESTIQYLAEQMRRFLRPHDRMLICFADEGNGSIGNMLARAVSRAGASPVFWGKDTRWKTLLRIAFTTRASAIAAPPLIALGITKLVKATGTPLYFRYVLTAGYPCMDWMIDGICRGLDCQSWGCFGPGTWSVVAGFSCGHSCGVHIRSDAFDVDIVDDNGEPVAEGVLGYPVITPKNRPDLRYHTRLHGRIDSSPCACGMDSPRLMDISAGNNAQEDLAKLGRDMLYWSSVLDCDLRIGESGLEMELVVFPGEKLPKLPSCAKQVVRPWDAERDKPMVMASIWKNQ